MKEVIHFLETLQVHNQREWFLAHKDDYLEAKNRFESFCLDLYDSLREADDTLGPLQPKDIFYRIYRDVRFSADKSPYKTHFGAFFCPEGRRSGYSGYYFQVGAAGSGIYENGHMLAVGNYWCDAKVLQTLREDILYGDDDFEAILHAADARFSLDTEGALKRVPKGFPEDSPKADFLKLKNFCLCYQPDSNRFVTGPDLKGRTLELFASATPFLQYVNRAVRLVKEESGLQPPR